MIYNLLNQICERYSGQELFSLDEKGYLLISNTKKDLLLCRQIGAAMKQYANQTVYFGISPLLKDETSFKLEGNRPKKPFLPAFFMSEVNRCLIRCLPP